MNYLYILGMVIWYGLGVVTYTYLIVLMVYMARILEITKRQVLIPCIIASLFSLLLVCSHYFANLHYLTSFINNIYVYSLLSLAPFVMICLVYFGFAGSHNIQNTYHFDIRYKKLREIKRLKEIIKEREGL